MNDWWFGFRSDWFFGVKSIIMMIFIKSNVNDFFIIRMELIVCVYDNFLLFFFFVLDYWCNFFFFKNIEKKGIIFM